MARRTSILVAVALMPLAACADAHEPGLVRPEEIAREHGTVAIVVQLDVPDLGTDRSPAWDPDAVDAAQEELLSRLGPVHVTFRPHDVPNIGLRLDARGIRRLERAPVLAGYYIDEGREPNAPPRY